MSKLLRNPTLDVVDALQQAPGLLKINEIFRRAIEQFGYDAHLCASPPGPDEDPLAPVMLDGWPRAWRDRYIARNYITRDATVRMMFTTYKPFTWDDSIVRMRPAKKDLVVFDEARAWRMQKGLVMPMPGNRANVVTLAGGSDARMDTEARNHLYMLALFAFGRAQHFHNRPVPRVKLTRRQIEVLRWVAEGETDSDIGERLGISESTVHKHVEGAKTAFGVSTRIQAVVAALRQGSIHY